MEFVFFVLLVIILILLVSMKGNVNDRLRVLEEELMRLRKTITDHALKNAAADSKLPEIVRPDPLKEAIIAKQPVVAKEAIRQVYPAPPEIKQEYSKEPPEVVQTGIEDEKLLTRLE